MVVFVLLEIKKGKVPIQADVLEAYYGKRKPRLKGVFAEMCGPGSTKTLLNYTESDPIQGTTYSYSGSGNYEYSGRNVFEDEDEDRTYSSARYGKGETDIHVREKTTAKDGTRARRAPAPIRLHHENDV
jgi:hypothetical protein